MTNNNFAQAFTNILVSILDYSDHGQDIGNFRPLPEPIRL